MADIFVSYAREDREYARALADRFLNYGWTVWWDRRIPIGRSFSDVIEEELQAARSVVVIWSPRSITSDWVQNEAADAAKRRVLIPVLVEDVRIPLEFRRIHAAQLIGWTPGTDHPELDELFSSLTTLLGTPPRAEPAKRAIHPIAAAESSRVQARRVPSRPEETSAANLSYPTEMVPDTDAVDFAAKNIRPSRVGVAGLHWLGWKVFAGLAALIGSLLIGFSWLPRSLSQYSSVGDTTSDQRPATEGSLPNAVTSPVDSATAANIAGTVTFEGVPPKAAAIKMAADPYCQKENPGLVTETEVVGAGGAVANVFVYVKDGLGNRTFATPSEPVTLDQKGCRYTPHVFGIQVGQPLEILNSDATLHNIHGLATANNEFSQGQPIQGMRMTHTFTTKEVMIHFKCDVHAWMNAWIGVLDHPYYAVTGADGTFSLKGLPPGTYTIEAWHEKFGTLTQRITIGPRQTKGVGFTYKAA